MASEVEKTPAMEVEVEPLNDTTNDEGVDTVYRGIIKFQEINAGHVNHRRREYIIINEVTGSVPTLQNLIHLWKLDNPKLVISLLGGYRGVKHITSTIRKAFVKELAIAVLSTGAWLTTDGLHSSLTKDVGEALRNYAIGRALAKQQRVVTIGIGPLSILKDKNELLFATGEVPIDMKQDEHGSARLDINHTHFLLINDDGSDPTRVTIAAQIKLLKAIVVKRMQGSRSGIPAVCIAIGGGHKEIRAIYETVVENRIPVIVLEGSGGAADLIAYAYRNMSTKDVNKHGSISVKTSIEFKTKFSAEFGDDKGEINMIEIMGYCRQIADRKSLVTILPLEEEDEEGKSTCNVEETVLNALLKAQHGNQSADQVHLATVLDRIDLAQRLLQGVNTLKLTDVKQSLWWALYNNQIEFVRLFLKKGLSLYDFLTKQELKNLYRTIKDDTLLYELLDEKTGDRSCSVRTNLELRHVGGVINDLTAWSFKPLYLHETFTDESDRFHNPARELFIWSVLQGRLEMAVLFWQECKSPIGGALVAGKILKELATTEMKLHEARRLTRYEEGKRLFNQLAVDVLSEYYESNRKLTTLTLVRVLQQWGSSNCLDLANNAGNMDFIAHPGVQNMLKEFWMGNLSIDNDRWKLWVCFVFPPAHLFIRLKLKEEESDPLVVKRLPCGKKKGEIKLREPATARWSWMSMLPGGGGRTNTVQGDSIDGSPGPNFTGLPLKPMNRKKRLFVDEDNTASTHASIARRFKALHTAPVIIFCYNSISKVFFLALFSYVLLGGFMTESPLYEEYILIGWVATMCTEILRQIICVDGPKFVYKVDTWQKYFWNRIDIATIIIFIAGYPLRFFDVTVAESQILLSIALILFYIRFLGIFSANKHMGPKLIMIEKMLVDILVFIGILGVFMVGYGVACEAILYPGRVGVIDVLRNIFYRPYMQIFGESFVTDEDENDGCLEYAVGYGNSTHPEPITACRRNTWFGLIMLAVYLFVVNILLLNLLIAMFNYTFTAVQERTNTFFRWHRYKLIKEYYKRPVLPPPFVIINHAILLIAFLSKRILRKCPRRYAERLSNYKTRSWLQNVNELSIWESVKGEDFLAKQRKREQQDILKKMQTNDHKFEEMSSRISKMEQEISKRMTTIAEELNNIQLLIKDVVAQRSEGGSAEVQQLDRD